MWRGDVGKNEEVREEFLRVEDGRDGGLLARESEFAWREQEIVCDVM